MTLADRISEFLKKHPGSSDREITDTLIRPGSPQQAINYTCRILEARGAIERHKRDDGRIGNYLRGTGGPKPSPSSLAQSVEPSGPLQEDGVKRALQSWLKSEGWQVTVIWGRGTGVDIDARRGNERWIVEVKGEGSRPQMRVNYFLAILGELLQRMDDPRAKYSVALPDLPQFRGLWKRLPLLAKQRTTITALFIDVEGRVQTE